MKKTIIAVILCLGLLVVFGAAAVGGEPAETGKKGAAVSYAEQDRIQAGGVTLGLDKGQTMAALLRQCLGMICARMRMSPSRNCGMGNRPQRRCGPFAGF